MNVNNGLSESCLKLKVLLLKKSSFRNEKKKKLFRSLFVFYFIFNSQYMEK